MHRVFRQLLLVALLAGCGRGAGPLRIGAAGPWQVGYGLMNRRGIELALEEINAGGGVRGRPLEVVMRDDEADGAKAVAIAQAFVADPRIAAVVGHVNSGTMVAAAKVYDGRLAAVATTATTPELTGISSWVFRVVPSDSSNGLDLARFASRLARARGTPGEARPRAAILYENDSYGRGLADAFRRNFRGDVVSADPIGDGGDQDVEPYVAYLKRGAPDVVFVATTSAAALAVLREARRQQLAATFLGGDGWNGVVSDTATSEGAYVGTSFSAADQRPEAQRFVAAFRARYGVTPDGNAALAYDATKLVARALAERGADREAVRDYLASLTDETAYRGVTGRIRFGPAGDPVGKGIVMTRAHAGALVVAEGER